MKQGLVLEGGAMRGLFSAGVCDVMMKTVYEMGRAEAEKHINDIKDFYTCE